MLGRTAAGLLLWLGSIVIPDWSGAGSFLWGGGGFKHLQMGGGKQLAIPWAGEDVR